ncbi:MAG: ROK family protein, partial [Parabacteroides sp.]|nr:ROK family protein [Parabacteroides sp.]
ETMNGNLFSRLQMKAYNLEDENESALFFENESKTVKIPGSSSSVIYEPAKKVGIITSNLGTNKAISLGAYCFALNNLNK